MKHKILIADDDKNIQELFDEIFSDDYDIRIAGNGEDTLRVYYEFKPHIVLLDIRMPLKDGMQVLKEIMKFNNKQIVVMITAIKEVGSAVTAMKLGAYDYIVKPFDVDELKIIVNKALESITLSNQVINLKQELRKFYKFENIIGESSSMLEVFSKIERVLDNNVPVLIRGESGTGKELVARAIHFNSKFSDGPFVAINCAAIPEQLIESELFGHEKGAFTGAVSMNVGKFELAHKGTLFLDEVGSLHYGLQAKLLRVLQDKKITRVGGSAEIKCDARIIAATSAPLEKLINKEKFRDDLYYRLNVFPITLPPLKDRKKDIPVLTAHFVKKYGEKLNKPDVKISPEALDMLVKHNWPGNVRELENMIERTIVLMNGDVIIPEYLSIKRTDKTKKGSFEPKTISQMEAELMEKTLEANNYNITIASRKLGITRKTLRTKAVKYGIIKN